MSDLVKGYWEEIQEKLQGLKLFQAFYTDEIRIRRVHGGYILTEKMVNEFYPNGEPKNFIMSSVFVPHMFADEVEVVAQKRSKR